MIPIGSISRTSHVSFKKILYFIIYMNRGRNGTGPYSRLETVKIRVWEKFGSGSISILDLRSGSHGHGLLVSLHLPPVQFLH